MLTYPATIPLSTRTLTYLAEQLRAQRAVRGTRSRRLDPGRQALLVLAHLRNGDTYTRLAAGFGIGVVTVYRYIREALDLPHRVWTRRSTGPLDCCGSSSMAR